MYLHVYVTPDPFPAFHFAPARARRSDQLGISNGPEDIASWSFELNSVRAGKQGDLGLQLCTGPWTGC